MAPRANDVTYLEKQRKRAHTSTVCLAAGYMFTRGNHAAHLLKAFTRTQQKHMQSVRTHLLISCPQQILTRAKLTERLKCRSPISGSGNAHLKRRFRVFSNPLNVCVSGSISVMSCFFFFLIQCTLIKRRFTLFSLCRGARKRRKIRGTAELNILLGSS